MGPLTKILRASIALRYVPKAWGGTRWDGWRNSWGYALGVFLDIERAFDSTSYKVIQKALTKHGISEALIDWTQSMLANRRLNVEHGEISVQGTPTKKCPQGGVLSPLLWSIVVNKLLSKLEAAGILTYDYADDIAIIARGKFLPILGKLIERTLKITQNWCQAKGLTVNPEKTSAIIFTRKYKPEPIKPLKLRGKKLNVVTSKGTRKILGPQAEGGIMAVPSRAITQTYIRSSGMVAQSGKSGDEEPTEEPTGKLPEGCSRDSKNDTHDSATSSAIKSGWDAETGHTTLGFLNSPPFMYKQDRIPRKYQEGRTAEVIIPSREQWRKADFLNGLRPDVWFTDGSGKDNRHGARIYEPTKKHRSSLPLEEYATVFQAEVKAIAECSQIQIADQTSSKKIYICSDSRAAINALIKQSTNSMTVWSCMRTLSKLGETNKVTLVWISGHQGIHGNEVADELAKQGTLIEPAGRNVYVPFVMEKRIIRKLLEKRHRESWKNEPGCRQAKLLMEQPKPERTRKLLVMSRQKLRIAIGLLTEHGTLRAHLHNLGIVEHYKCRLCKEENEDSIHILCHCPVLAVKRYLSWKKMFTDPGQLREARVNSLISLANHAGLRTKIHPR
ncbi:uncharacterized protein [Cardiocondyla obscurior]|uniref:uncharacterized protein n=1 Tax=Cardiocondyla obscurior TaxID=286306 RepID=UPI0039657E3E